MTTCNDLEDQDEKTVRKAVGHLVDDAIKGLLGQTVPSCGCHDRMMAQWVGIRMRFRHTDTFIGKGCLHDDKAWKGERRLTFQPELPVTGKSDA